MEINELQTWGDVAKYIVQQTYDQDTTNVFMALSVASALTYMMFFTDIPESLAGQVGEVSQAIMGATPSAEDIVGAGTSIGGMVL